MNNSNKHEHRESLLPGPSVSNRIEHFFSDFFSDSNLGLFKHSHFKEPRVNISEDNKAYYVEASLAGFGKENVKVDCKNNVLSISAKKEEKKEESKKNYHCVECHSGSFYRSFQLPENVSNKGIDAEMKDGLLKITLPKSEEKTSVGNGITIR